MTMRMAIKAAGAVMPRLAQQPFNVSYSLGPLGTWDWRGLTALFDLAMALASLTPSIYHFTEVGDLPGGGRQGARPV